MKGGLFTSILALSLVLQIQAQVVWQGLGNVFYYSGTGNTLSTYNYQTNNWITSTSISLPAGFTVGGGAPYFSGGKPLQAANAVSATSSGSFIVNQQNVVGPSGSISFPNNFPALPTTTKAWDLKGNLLLFLSTTQIWLWSQTTNSWSQLPNLPSSASCSSPIAVSDSNSIPYLLCDGTLYHFDGLLWSSITSRGIPPTGSVIVWSDNYGNVYFATSSSSQAVAYPISIFTGPILNINITTSLLKCTPGTLDASYAYTPSGGNISYSWSIASNTYTTPVVPINANTDVSYSLKLTDTLTSAAKQFSGTVKSNAGSDLIVYNGPSSITLPSSYKGNTYYSYTEYTCQKTTQYNRNSNTAVSTTNGPQLSYVTYSTNTLGNKITLAVGSTIPASVQQSTCYPGASTISSVVSSASNAGASFSCVLNSASASNSVLLPWNAFSLQVVANSSIPLITFSVPPNGINLVADSVTITSAVQISYNGASTDCNDAQLLCLYQWSSNNIGSLDMLSVSGSTDSYIEFSPNTISTYAPILSFTLDVEVYSISSSDNTATSIQSGKSSVSLQVRSLPVQSFNVTNSQGNTFTASISNIPGVQFSWGFYSINVVSNQFITSYGTSLNNNMLIPNGDWNIVLTTTLSDGSHNLYTTTVNSVSGLGISDALTQSQNSVDVTTQLNYAYIYIVADPLTGYPTEFPTQSVMHELLVNISRNINFQTDTISSSNYAVVVNQFINKYTSADVSVVLDLLNPMVNASTISPALGKNIFSAISSVFVQSNVSVNTVSVDFVPVGLRNIFADLDTTLVKVSQSPLTSTNGVQYDTSYLSTVSGMYNINNLRGKKIQNGINRNESAQFILPYSTSKYGGLNRAIAVMYTMKFNPFFGYLPQEIFYRDTMLSYVAGLSIYDENGTYVPITSPTVTDETVLYKMNIPIQHDMIQAYNAGGYAFVCLYWNSTGGNYNNGTLGNDGMFPDKYTPVLTNGYVNCTSNHLTNFTVALFKVSGKRNLGLLIGLPLGAAALVGIVLGGSIFYVRRKSKQYKKRRQEDEELMERNKKATNFEPIKADAIQVLQRIGGGAFGDVYKGMYLGTTEVALKKLSEGAGQDVQEEFKQEADMLQKLQHPNVTQFLGIWISQEGEQYLVTEFMAKGSLLSVLRDVNERPTIQDILKMCQATAAGMNYLADRSVVHRDLAARNLLVRSEGREYVVKVADFGMSRTTDEQAMYESKSNKFPVKWSAPEILHFRKYSTKSDVWAFGIVMWEILEYGKIPYPDMNNAEASQRVLEGYRLPRPNNCPPEIYNVMLSCWESDPAARPTFGDLWKTISNILVARGDIDTSLLDDQYIPVPAPAPDVKQLYNNGENMYSLDDKVRPQSQVQGAGIYNSKDTDIALQSEGPGDIYSFSDNTVNNNNRNSAKPPPAQGEDIYSYDDSVQKGVKKVDIHAHATTDEKEEASDMYSYDPRAVQQQQQQNNNNRQDPNTESMYATENLYSITK